MLGFVRVGISGQGNGRFQKFCRVELPNYLPWQKLTIDGTGELE